MTDRPPPSSTPRPFTRPAPDDDPDKTVLATTWSRTTLEPAAQAHTSTNTLPIGTRVGEFEITDVIGEGGFGVVYAARDHVLKRTVALKEYMPSALASRQHDLSVSVKSNQHIETFLIGLKSFINEAQLLAQFDHPALVKVFRFWEANKTAYMVMPLYEGGTLKQALKARRDSGRGAPDEAWLRKLLAPLLDALSTLHAADCLHRDIAPDNILLVGGDKAEPRPLLLDFGAARRVIGESTQALTVILKPGYAPIEQYDEIPGMKQGPWTDLYALAAVIHFAITGKAPPPSVRRLMHDPYVPLAQQHELQVRYSAHFLNAIDATLGARAESRPQNAAQLGRALMGESFTTVSKATEPASGRATLAAVSPPTSGSIDARPAAVVHATSGRRSSWWSLIALGAGTFIVLVAGALFIPELWRSWVTAPSVSTALPERKPRAEPAALPTQAQSPIEAEVQGATAEAQVAEPVVVPPPPVGKRASAAPAAASEAKTASAQPPRPPRAREGAPNGRNARPADLPEWVAPALAEARECLAQRRFGCTIERTDQVLRSDPAHPVALDLHRQARAGQEAALTSDWKMR